MGFIEVWVFIGFGGWEKSQILVNRWCLEEPLFISFPSLFASIVCNDALVGNLWSNEGWKGFLGASLLQSLQSLEVIRSGRIVVQIIGC